MITLPELAAEALGSFLASDLKNRFGSSHARLAELIPFAARLALECNISRRKRRLNETAHFAPPISAGSEPAWRRFDWRELGGVAHAARRQHGRIPH